MSASGPLTIAVLEPNRDGRVGVALTDALARHFRRSGIALKLVTARSPEEIGPETRIVFATRALAAASLSVVPTFVIIGAEDVEPALTPIDTLALLHDGAAGVIEGSALVLDEVIESALRRGDRALLVGSAARNYAEFHRTVTVDWPSDGHGDLDRPTFGAATALAQIQVLRPVAEGHRGHSWSALALALNAKQGTTSFRADEDTLRRVLPRLGKLWAPAEEIVEEDPFREHEGLEGAQRARLPDLARANGFPERPPRLRDVAAEDVADELYDQLADAIEPQTEDVRGTCFAYTSIPRARARGRR
jgi:hypothetical protein